MRQSVAVVPILFGKAHIAMWTGLLFTAIIESTLTLATQGSPKMELPDLTSSRV